MGTCAPAQSLSSHAANESRALLERSPEARDTVRAGQGVRRFLKRSCSLKRVPRVSFVAGKKGFCPLSPPHLYARKVSSRKATHGRERRASAQQAGTTNLRSSAPPVCVNFVGEQNKKSFPVSKEPSAAERALPPQRASEPEQTSVCQKR